MLGNRLEGFDVIVIPYDEGILIELKVRASGALFGGLPAADGQ